MKSIKTDILLRSFRMGRVAICMVMAALSLGLTSCGDDEPDTTGGNLVVPDQDLKITWNSPTISQKGGATEIGERIQLTVSDAYGKYNGEDYVPVDYALMCGTEIMDGKVSGVSDSKYVTPLAFENPFTEAGPKKCILRVHYIIPNQGKFEKNYEVTILITEPTE